METKETVEKLRRLIMNHGLPGTDMALFGIKCPYCGKSDRIRKLEAPDELEGGLDPDDMEEYSLCWKNLAPIKEALGVCKFCQNPLRISIKEGSAEGL
jgi:hypothetical protein